MSLGVALTAVAFSVLLAHRWVGAVQTGDVHQFSTLAGGNVGIQHGRGGDGGESTDELVEVGDIPAGSASWTTDCGDFTTMWSNIILTGGVKAKTKPLKCP